MIDNLSYLKIFYIFKSFNKNLNLALFLLVIILLFDSFTEYLFLLNVSFKFALLY